MNASAFTRARKLPLPKLVSFLLNAPRSGLQSELNAFFDHALGSTRPCPLSKSAFCQARRGLKPEALRALLRTSGALLATHSTVPHWQGWRVLALDSTSLRVPDTPECAEHFSGMNTAGGRFRPLARASALFDVARHCFVDARLGGNGDDERTLAAGHLDVLGKNDLVVMDRGYPSREWLRAVQNTGAAFCARICHVRWRAVRQFAQGAQQDAVVDLGTPEQALPVRLIHHVLPNGSKLYLVTNLTDPAMTPAMFVQLYRGRWQIEEAFKLIKARMQVENWSGLLPHTVYQDFYATLVRANCAAILALEAQETAPAPKATTGWQTLLNRTLAVKSLRHYLPRLLLGLDVADCLRRLQERLRSSGAFERTRPERRALRLDKVRLAGFHLAYKAA